MFELKLNCGRTGVRFFSFFAQGTVCEHDSEQLMFLKGWLCALQEAHERVETMSEAKVNSNGTMNSYCACSNFSANLKRYLRLN